MNILKTVFKIIEINNVLEFKINKFCHRSWHFFQKFSIQFNSYLNVRHNFDLRMFRGVHSYCKFICLFNG